MKKVTDPTPDVGVIVGRFQVHELTPAHIDLIKTVCDNHKKVIIFLGMPSILGSQNNPLDYEARKQMIEGVFPSVIIMYLKNMKSDHKWSAQLDTKIKDLVGPSQSVMLYGSRDSFIKSYHGKYKTQEMVQETFYSGSEIRKSISLKVINTPEFRAGVIWGSFNQYSKCFCTVDIAIFNEDYTKVLLARKPDETKFRFVGGFSDPKSDSYEADARREVQEETSLEITDLKYIGSFKIQDWRYKNEQDCIKTLFFTSKVMYGRPEANDDICELKWFDISSVKEDDLVDEHHILLNSLKNK